MTYRHFSILLMLRLVVVRIAMAATLWLWLQPGYHSATLAAAAIMLIASAELWRHVYRTNKEVTRFLEAARYADFSQRFEMEELGTGFGPLGDAFTEILQRFRTARATHETENRRLRALVEHIPVPLMSIHADNTITLQNNAARRLFGAAQVARLEDLNQFGPAFCESVSSAVPGRRELVTFAVEGVEYRLTLAATEIIIGERRDRLISLQDIQTELDVTQADAWQDLVRVLTHEIVNSITPITSLASTASHLVDDVIDKAGRNLPLANDLDDLKDAVSTVERRSGSLLQFVDSYRQLTRLAPPERKRVPIGDLFHAVQLLTQAEWPDSPMELTAAVKPETLDVFADRDLLEPVLINLIRNAVHATAGLERPRITLSSFLSGRGSTVIEVADNGPGVPEEIARKIFVPFFTTKEKGSGVGLALARQVMVAHGGFITVGRADLGGARFSLIF
jgi:nitrogen fixation/metabolism regulation signal transduction histidine kinase